MKIYLDIKNRLLYLAWIDIIKDIGFNISLKPEGAIAIVDNENSINIGKVEIKKPFLVNDIFKYLNEDYSIIFAEKFLFSIKTRTISMDDKSQVLTSVEANILNAIISNKSGISADEISKHILGYSHNSISKSPLTHIQNIRKKLDQIERDANIIKIKEGKYFI